MINKRSVFILFLFLNLLACSSSQKQSAKAAAPATLPVQAANELPKPALDETHDEQALNEWQDQKHKNYFDWPVDEARMTRGFLPNRKKPHLGIDLAAPKGTKILAAQDGTVIYTGRDFRGFGRLIMIEGVNGWASFYAHLSTIAVKEGQKVKQGQVIGGMGRSGHATGVHLHFEIRRTQGPVDPLLYLPGGSRLAGR
jgi:murein DD-endopeptidase MepM/ murein hydrolase activator NlpD